MKQECRRLLIEDIMGRIPYGVKFDFDGLVGTATHICYYPLFNKSEYDCICELDIFGGGGDNLTDIECFKPYLFPLSSMTEEQEEEYVKHYDIDLKNSAKNLKDRLDGKDVINGYPMYNHIDWLNKNHFDYRGLIEKGLAIDATDKDIY